ncbi:hypothetical protein [Peptococcus niger]|uniref:hypothetical protein n=1 Tax=Peptococcus niger TaxID=2741 RepID=UPI000B86EE61|nr:hypothetical protein [Peptococcus niger]
MKTAKEQTQARLSPRPKRAFCVARKGKRGAPGHRLDFIVEKSVALGDLHFIKPSSTKPSDLSGGLFRGQNIMGKHNIPEK